MSTNFFCSCTKALLIRLCGHSSTGLYPWPYWTQCYLEDMSDKEWSCLSLKGPKCSGQFHKSSHRVDYLHLLKIELVISFTKRYNQYEFVINQSDPEYVCSQMLQFIHTHTQTQTPAAKRSNLTPSCVMFQLNENSFPLRVKGQNT